MNIVIIVIKAHMQIRPGFWSPPYPTHILAWGGGGSKVGERVGTCSMQSKCLVPHTYSAGDPSLLFQQVTPHSYSAGDPSAGDPSL